MLKLNYYGITMVSGDSYEIVQFPLVPLCDDLQTNLAITFRVNDRYRFQAMATRVTRKQSQPQWTNRRNRSAWRRCAGVQGAGNIGITNVCRRKDLEGLPTSPPIGTVSTTKGRSYKCIPRPQCRSNSFGLLILALRIWNSEIARENIYITNLRI